MIKTVRKFFQRNRQIHFLSKILKFRLPDTRILILNFFDTRRLTAKNKKNRKKSQKNVKLTGKIANKEVYNELNNSDLLIITSDNEGQPKVSLEAASLGVPTCYIKENYKIDYISNMETGFEADSIEDMIKIIKKINNNSELLKKNSRNVAEVAKKYSWNLLIKDYEKYFEKTL